MELTNTEGKTYKFRGSLCSEFVVQGVDLSDLLRQSLDMPDLYVFDGNNKPDIVNRIEVFYHRITKIKPKEPISEHTEYAVWDYTESLIVPSHHSSTPSRPGGFPALPPCSRRFWAKGFFQR